jgi:uncharacterized flavoprotein (TIGR03862 family)
MQKQIAIIGGGPSGLMAAEILANKGHAVTVYDKMPSLGRKLLMAGRGGLNITHSEPVEKFISRYREKADWLTPYINNFTPTDLQKWCNELGQETFIGSSGRIFPKAMKAAPLLRAWLKRLNNAGVKFAMKHNWQGWQGDKLHFKAPENKDILIKPDATLLALGGASWPKLGSDGAWVKYLTDIGVEISNLKPANCGFEVEWSEYFKQNFAGQPVKPVSIKCMKYSQQGEVMITSSGIEGGAVYALSAVIRDEILKNNHADISLDLRPNMNIEDLHKKLSKPKGKQSFSSFMRKAGFSSLIVNLLREANKNEELNKLNAKALAEKIKNLPLKVIANSGISKAISTAGGIKVEALDEFMLKAKPGVFATGEMLDWEAPTGGYLLQACFSLALASANNIQDFLNS